MATPVSGKVTYKGKPVTEGEVTLAFPDIGVATTALLDETGSFTMDTPMPVGIYSACVRPQTLPPVEPGTPEPKVKPSPDIPKKARDLKTSGLSVPLNKGKNEVTLELKD